MTFEEWWNKKFERYHFVLNLDPEYWARRAWNAAVRTMAEQEEKNEK